MAQTVAVSENGTTCLLEAVRRMETPAGNPEWAVIRKQGTSARTGDQLVVAEAAAVAAVVGRRETRPRSWVLVLEMFLPAGRGL